MIDLTQYRRRATHEVRIGACTIGGTHPVAVQSMTNTDTRDTADLVRELSFTVRNKSGDETVYSFYTLSTLTCFVTVNGDGEFYTNRAYIEKVVNNVDMLMSGKEIKADY